MLKKRGSWEIAVIDFGLAYRPSQTFSSARRLNQGLYSVLGTLPYASLNAHERSSKIVLTSPTWIWTHVTYYLDLIYRDDLESLVYTLIYLLKGKLPWSYYATHGSKQGCTRQVYEQKKRFNGQSFASEVPVVFCRLLDYARSLSVNSFPDYKTWRGNFQQYAQNAYPIQPCRWRAKIAVTGVEVAFIVTSPDSWPSYTLS